MVSAVTAMEEFPVLDQIAQGRDHLETGPAAQVLNRKVQTLRRWACEESGPVRPVRINGRLAWPVQQIRRVLRGEVK